MRDYIRAGMRATIAMFNDKPGADERIDEINAHNHTIADRVFAHIVGGGYAYSRIGEQMSVYHRSTQGAVIQITHFCMLRGEWSPTMHENINTVNELEQSLPDGHYINYKTI